MMYRGLLILLASGFVFTTSVGMEQQQDFFEKEVVWLRLQEHIVLYCGDVPKTYDVELVQALPVALAKADNFAIGNYGNKGRILELSDTSKVTLNDTCVRNEFQRKLDTDYKNTLYFVILHEKEDHIVNVLSRTELYAMYAASNTRVSRCIAFNYNDLEGAKIDGFMRLYALRLCDGAEFEKAVTMVRDIGWKWWNHCSSGENAAHEKGEQIEFLQALPIKEINELIEAFKDIQLPEKSVVETDSPEIPVIAEIQQQKSWTPYIVIGGCSLAAIAALIIMYNRSSCEGLQKIVTGVLDRMALDSFSHILDAISKHFKRT